MKISEHFDRKEFACHDNCGGDTVDVELITVLEALRSLFGKEVIVVSGFRCEAHNKNVGGAHTSQHLTGKAADITIDGITPVLVAGKLKKWYPGKYGIGVYDSWVHIDVRPEKARW